MSEIIRVYAHRSNDDESAYELADAFANRDDDGFITFHDELRGLAYEVKLYYEIDPEAETTELIGIKDGDTTIGETPDPTWDYEHNRTSGLNPEPPDPTGIHQLVTVPFDDGDYRTVCSCQVTEDDIRDDGTISYPPSGDCDHHEEP